MVVWPCIMDEGPRNPNAIEDSHTTMCKCRENRVIQTQRRFSTQPYSREEGMCDTIQGNEVRATQVQRRIVMRPNAREDALRAPNANEGWWCKPIQRRELVRPNFNREWCAIQVQIRMVAWPCARDECSQESDAKEDGHKALYKEGRSTWPKCKWD